MNHQTETALKLVRKGFHVFPVAPYKKKPLINDIYHGCARDEEGVHRLFSSIPPEAGVAFLLAQSGLIKVDLDQYKPGFCFPYEVPRTWSFRTPSGGLNLLFKKDNSFSYRSKLYDEDGEVIKYVDVISNGHQIMPPHLVNMVQSDRKIYGRYQIECDVDPAPMPNWVYTSAFVPTERKPISHEHQDVTIDDVRLHLTFLRNDEVDWHHWKKIGGALHNCEMQFGWEPGTGLELWHEWSEKSTAYDPALTDREWQGIERSRFRELGIQTILWLTYQDPDNQEYRKAAEAEWDRNVREQLDNAPDLWD
jgi:hypothetical protein